jgi:hypothetical protein
MSFSILLIITILVGTIIVSGCDDPNIIQSPYYEYFVRVNGLEYFTTDNGTAHILLPAPLINGTDLLPFKGDSGYGNNATLPPEMSYNGWDKNVVSLATFGYHGISYVTPINTSYGRMIDICNLENGSYETRLSTTDETHHTIANTRTINKSSNSFDNIDIEITKVLGQTGSKDAEAPVNCLINNPMHTDTGDLLPAGSLPVSDEPLYSNTSPVYIDPDLRPIDNRNHSLKITIFFEVVVGERPYGGPGDHYVFTIEESIPAGVTGYVPVTVYYHGNMKHYSPESELFYHN